MCGLYSPDLRDSSLIIVDHSCMMIPVVECCIRISEERRQRDAHMVWRNTEVWTRERSRT